MNTEVLYTNNDKSDTEHVALVTIQDCTKFDKFYVKRQKNLHFGFVQHIILHVISYR